MDIQKVIAAIRDANRAILAFEGIDLLYGAEACADNPDTIILLRSLIGPASNPY